MTEFVDISYSQPANLNFSTMKANGIVAAYCKMGGCQNQLGPYIDSKYRTFAPAARASGMGVGHYFFNGDALTPSAAAKFFSDNLSGYTANDGLALDIEGDGSQPQWSPDKAYEFASALYNLRGRKPDMYLNLSTARNPAWQRLEDFGSRLWLAYPGALPSNIGPWNSVAMHQYTIAAVPGSPVALDRDRTIGSATWNNVANVVPPAVPLPWQDWSKF